MKLLVILLFSMLSFSAVAQEPSYRPLIEEGKVWHYEGSNPNSPPEYRQTWMKSYWLEGDTVIGTYQCTKLYATSNGTIEKIERCYCGALYEDGAKVFHIPAGSVTPHLLYDFSCQEAQVVIISNSALIIVNRFAVPCNGVSRIVLNWYPKEFTLIQNSWIEGIGSTFDLLEYIGCWNPGNYSYTLLSCEVKGKVIFDSQAFKSIMTGCKPLSASPTVNSHRYDLTGRRLTATPAKGVYIESGRKRAVK